MSTDPQLLPGGSTPAPALDPNGVNIEEEAYEPPTYDDAFPPMESAAMGGGPKRGKSQSAASYASKMAVKSSVVTQVSEALHLLLLISAVQY